MTAIIIALPIADDIERHAIAPTGVRSLRGRPWLIVDNGFDSTVGMRKQGHATQFPKPESGLSDLCKPYGGGA